MWILLFYYDYIIKVIMWILLFYWLYY